jgi:hypothetical protein
MSAQERAQQGHDENDGVADTEKKHQQGQELDQPQGLAG